MTIQGPFDLQPEPDLYQPAKGDTVRLLDSATWPEDKPNARFPGRWQVEKVNPRTCRVLPLDGQPQRSVAVDRALMRKVTGDEGTTHTPAGSAVTVDLPEMPFVAGTVVYWKTAPPKAGGTVFVIEKDEGGPTVARVVLLGGDGGRFWRRVTRRALTEIPAAAIREAAQTVVFRDLS